MRTIFNNLFLHLFCLVLLTILWCRLSLEWLPLVIFKKQHLFDRTGYRNTYMLLTPNQKLWTVKDEVVQILWDSIIWHSSLWLDSISRSEWTRIGLVFDWIMLQKIWIAWWCIFHSVTAASFCSVQNTVLCFFVLSVYCFERF